MRSVDPAIWGPSGWNLVHGLAAYAAKDPEISVVFPKLFLLLPCAACQHNYQRHLNELPIPSDPKKLLKWSYELHERVNTWKGETVAEVSFKDVEKQWKEHVLSWHDVWTFLEAVTEAHPGANRITREYLDQLLLLFRVLGRVLPLRTIKTADVLYKMKLRGLLREIKRKNHIVASHIEFTCSSAVCHM